MLTEMRGAWLFPLALGVAVGCGRCAREPEPVLESRECASACAALVGAGCERPELAPEQERACGQACVDRARQLASAGCGAERSAYLACVSTARVDCSRARCSASSCIEEHHGIDGCQAEHVAYRRCIAPCLHAGVTHVSDKTMSIGEASRRVMAETERLGCRQCAASDLEKGAPAGSVCQSPKVCAESCCPCPGGRAHFAARVCTDGACAGEEACSLAKAVGPDPCGEQ